MDTLDLSSSLDSSSGPAVSTHSPVSSSANLAVQNTAPASASSISQVPSSSGGAASSSRSGSVSAQVSNGGPAAGSVAGNAWKPRESGVLLTSLREHSAAVRRISVAADQSFFSSASEDGTVKIWQTRMLDRVAFPR